MIFRWEFWVSVKFKLFWKWRSALPYRPKWLEKDLYRSLADWRSKDSLATSVKLRQNDVLRLIGARLSREVDDVWPVHFFVDTVQKEILQCRYTTNIPTATEHWCSYARQTCTPFQTRDAVLWRRLPCQARAHLLLRWLRNVAQF